LLGDELVYWTEVDGHLKLVRQLKSGECEPLVMGVEDWKDALKTSLALKDAEPIHLEVFGLDSTQVFRKA
jgi:hypothetical protein